MMFIFFVVIPLIAFLMTGLTGAAVHSRFQREYGRKPLVKESSTAEKILVYLRLLIPLLNIAMIFIAMFMFDQIYEKICEIDLELGGDQSE